MTVPDSICQLMFLYHSYMCRGVDQTCLIDRLFANIIHRCGTCLYFWQLLKTQVF